MNKIEKILSELFGKYRIECFPISNIGYFSNFLDGDETLRGSGLRSLKEESINVAISEAVERYCFRYSASNNTHLTNIFKSSCGFSVGLNDEKVKLRSFFEAFERWAISKWIDENFYIDEVENNELTPLAKFFCNDFKMIKRYEKHYKATFLGAPIDLKLGVSIALTESGAFMGSRVTLPHDDPWEHSIAECWAAMKSNSYKSETNSIDSLIDKRIKFFSENQNDALKQIEKAKNINNLWPKFEIIYHSKVLECPEPFHCYRTIANDYKDWMTGEVNRFVY